MSTSSVIVDKARQLAAAGHHAEVVEYLAARAEHEIEASPSLALLYGTAQARLGRHDEGRRWLDVALDGARKKDERMVERHALNARGALALVGGRTDEAADHFTRALMVASGDGDHPMIGRCSNNLGIISSLKGRHAEAIGSWEIAVAAFDRAGLRQGVAECRHNLGIAHRGQGSLDSALAEADRAVAEAEAAGDETLKALALRGRVETRVLRGELETAWRELDQVRETRSRLPNPVDAAEDLRVAALMLAVNGEVPAAEKALRSVVEQAAGLRQPQLLAEANRDLAILLGRSGRDAQAREAARAARAAFAALGAEGEIRRLASHAWDDDFAAELRQSLAPLHLGQQLADAGRYDELVTYLAGRPQEELEQSPMLALLNGIGQSRLGRLDAGKQWAMLAVSRARVAGDRKLEVRGLNVCGAIALERGGINEATHFFMRAQEEATQENDMATVGRCANNLGVIANMQGDYGRAVGAYTRAIAAYQIARNDRGIVESEHNLAISHREQGRLDDAMRAADAAVGGAERLGDRGLRAQAMAGRAEIQVARGEAALAVREAERALAVHRELKDGVRESEDMRILAVALGRAGKVNDAEKMLRQVIDRATQHQRLLLVAMAQRDLAQLVAGRDMAAAIELARTARATFDRLGAEAEVTKLDSWLGGTAQARSA